MRRLTRRLSVWSRSATQSPIGYRKFICRKISRLAHTEAAASIVVAIARTNNRCVVIFRSRKTPPDPASDLIASVPLGLRVYAIGDIHGRLDLLNVLARDVKTDLERGLFKDAVSIFLGDYIDRRPDSAGVVERLTIGDFPTRNAYCRFAGEPRSRTAEVPTPEPEILANRIGVDTGAYATGRLTCLILEGQDRRFIST